MLLHGFIRNINSVPMAVFPSFYDAHKPVLWVKNCSRKSLHTPTLCTLTCTCTTIVSFFLRQWKTYLKGMLKTCCPGGFQGMKATSAFRVTSLFFCPEDKSCRQKPERQTEVELFQPLSFTSIFSSFIWVHSVCTCRTS